MKIIIAGAGEVGFHVAKMLSNEDHDIVLIDKDEHQLDHAASHIDVSVIKGNAISIKLLEEAGIENADLLIAATSSEETNITASIIGKKLGARRTITRIANPEFQKENDKLEMKNLGIDAMVFPEDLASKEIFRLIQQSSVTDSFDFGGGKLMLNGYVVGENAPIKGKTLIEVARDWENVKFTVVAILRGEKTIIPRGDCMFKSNDHIYFISKPEFCDDLRILSGQEKVEIKEIMILGGSLIGRIFAKKVQNDYQVKLIEKNKEKCFDLASELDKTLVLRGDGNNVELLEEEGIENMDAFISVTGDSETNIIACLVAKTHGVKRAIALVENIDYISLSQRIGIDTLINKKMIAINNIFRYVREGKVEALTSLHGVESEVLEFSVTENCKITQQVIKKLKFPRDAIIAGIIRNGEGVTASGDMQIQPGDKVVVFTLPSVVHRVEKFFADH